MPFQTIYTSGTGMLGMEKKLNTVSNNLANAETTAYKKQRCNFEDLYYDNLRYPGSQDVNGEYAATGIAIGVGTRVTSIQADFSQGTHTETGRDLDISIDGEGFLQVMDSATGERFYTRAGNLNLNANRQLVVGSTHQGRVLDPVIDIPQGTKKIQIDEFGVVYAVQNDEVNVEQVGQIMLSRFVNPEGLLRLGENMYRETYASGPPEGDGMPLRDGYGMIKQQYLEMSNVAPVIELIDMITSQRTYELNSKSTQTGDQMLQTVIGIKR